MNESAENFMNLKLEQEFELQQMKTIIPKLDRQKLEELFLEVLRQKHVQKNAFVFFMKTGERLPILSEFPRHD